LRSCDLIVDLGIMKLLGEFFLLDRLVGYIHNVYRRTCLHCFYGFQLRSSDVEVSEYEFVDNKAKSLKFGVSLMDESTLLHLFKGVHWFVNMFCF
jgi:hypothetical protein